MATCEALYAQAVQLAKEIDGLRARLRGDEGDVKELEQDASHTRPDVLAAAKKRLADDQARLKQLGDQLQALRKTLQDQHCLFQPQQILETTFHNPGDVKVVDSLFAQTVAFGHQDPSTVFGGPFPSLDAQQEWKQVQPADLTNTAAHDMDYEGELLVGATGWVLSPEFSGGDFPFDHPFGFDWEFLLALDQPADDPSRYTFLLAPADQSCQEGGMKEAIKQADGLEDPAGKPIIPQGPNGLPSLLGVEVDGGLVPEQFYDWWRGGVDQGDRMAVFGRWIVDCGHQIPITRSDDKDVVPGETAFRTEIHPPLLMANAKVTTSRLAAPAPLHARQVTRVLFTSRPYLVSQRFTTDTSNVYDDFLPDDGTFVPHMLKEVRKVNEIVGGIPTSSLRVEAHPKIRSYPFKGSYKIHLIVRPPPANAGSRAPVAHGPLAVAFQFTVRTGCWVEVLPSGTDAVEVVITMDSASYRPPDLPARRDRNWTKDELEKLNAAAGSAYLTGEAVSTGLQLLYNGVVAAAEVDAILARGILTDEYDTKALTAADLSDASHALSALASDIPGSDARAQLATLIKERDSLTARVAAQRGSLKELLSERTHVPQRLIAKMEAELAAEEAKLKHVTEQVNALMAELGKGVRQDDSQPFPVGGWLEVGYLPLQERPGRVVPIARR